MFNILYLVKSYGYKYNIYIGIIILCAKSFKSIRILAYKVSFCYAVNLKFLQMLS